MEDFYFKINIFLVQWLVFIVVVVFVKSREPINAFLFAESSPVKQCAGFDTGLTHRK